jgi:hypothetical protein
MVPVRLVNIKFAVHTTSHTVIASVGVPKIIIKKRYKLNARGTGT